MTASRHPDHGLIDRSRPLDFTFDGRAYQGVQGDTVASALLAAGVTIFGRSFKYHRPRGLWGSWFDDPNSVVDIKINGTSHPNCLATTTYATAGMEVRSVNNWPSARFDVKSVLDLGNRFLPAGFYYKMFMWPNWHLYEPSIRKMAGMGALSADVADEYNATILSDACDTLVIGGGVAGLTAANAAAQAGQSVVLVDDHPEAGGGSYRWNDGNLGRTWVQEQVARLEAHGGRFLPRTTAIGVYDHKLVSLVESNGPGAAPIVRKMRAGRIVLASGAIDRPMTFANNDRPGIMSLEGAAEYLARYGVLVGQKCAIVSNRPDADQIADRLSQAGAQVELCDASATDLTAMGRRQVKGLRIGGRTVDCDAVLTSTGLTPLIHLWRHAGGKLDWDDGRQTFVPATGPDWMTVIGAANGTFLHEHILEEASAAASNSPLPKRAPYSLPPAPLDIGTKSRQWVDFQHDVTLKDIALAKRENLVSVEHLKRYTTLGMAGDQGKTSNIAGLAAMAALQGRSIPKVGTTTFRPPFVPIPLEAYSGQVKGRQISALKRLALEPEHRALDAAMGEYGGWLRPAWFGNDGMEAAVARECQIARTSAAIMDGSALGSIEVMGPDARAFVNFVYYNTMSTLKPGRIRYGFMLSEAGIVFDDGVMACIDDNRFVISCSSSHVDAVAAHLENWRHDSFDPDRVFVHDATQTWSTVTIAGPKASQIIADLNLSPEGGWDEFPHMSWRAASYEGFEARISRVSFTGDTSYEISVPNRIASALWQRALECGAPHAAGPVGAEALSVLRAEKGYILVGKDTDGETMPHDLGFGAPRLKKSAAFVGDRSLHTATGNREDRKTLIGLESVSGPVALPIGAHIVDGAPGAWQSKGYVTSSYETTSTGAPIALGLVSVTGLDTDKPITLFHKGQTQQARIVSSCAFDREGSRIDA